MAQLRRTNLSVAPAIVLFVLVGVGCGGDTRPAARQAAVSAPTVREIALSSTIGSGQPRFSKRAGHLMLSWLESASGHSEFRTSAWRDGSWTEPTTIPLGESPLANWADVPAVALDAGGAVAAAAWVSASEGAEEATRVRVARLDARHAALVAATTHRVEAPAEFGFPSFFPLAGEALGIVWLDGRAYASASATAPPAQALYTTTLDAAGDLGAERCLDDRVCDCCPTSAVDVGSVVVVAYRDRTMDEERDISVVRLVDGDWTAPAVVHADHWQIQGCPVNGPALATSNGTVVVAWYTAAKGTPHVHAASSSDAAAHFSVPFTLDDGKPAGLVGVALESADRGAAVWIEQVADERSIRVRGFDTSGRMGASIEVAKLAAGGRAGYPRIEWTGAGYMVAWTTGGEGARVATAMVSPPLP